MYKIQRISNFQHSFSFSIEQFDSFYQRFLQGDLGKIYLAIPWDELVSSFGLMDSNFSPKGKLTLMFLKHYGYCSDRRLIEQLNGNLEWQFFCGIYLGSEWSRLVSNSFLQKENKEGIEELLKLKQKRLK